MVFGLATDEKKAGSNKAKNKATKKSGNNADEAAEILKKMEAKKDAGDCPFC